MGKFWGDYYSLLNFSPSQLQWLGGTWHIRVRTICYDLSWVTAILLDPSSKFDSTSCSRKGWSAVNLAICAKTRAPGYLKKQYIYIYIHIHVPYIYIYTYGSTFILKRSVTRSIQSHAVRNRFACSRRGIRISVAFWSAPWFFNPDLGSIFLVFHDNSLVYLWWFKIILNSDFMWCSLIINTLWIWSR